jgi:hypothetical protein
MVFAFEGLKSWFQAAASLALLVACVCPRRLMKRLAYAAGGVHPLPTTVAVASLAGPVPPELDEELEVLLDDELVAPLDDELVAPLDDELVVPLDDELDPVLDPPPEPEDELAPEPELVAGPELELVPPEPPAVEACSPEEPQWMSVAAKAIEQRKEARFTSSLRGLALRGRGEARKLLSSSRAWRDRLSRPRKRGGPGRQGGGSGHQGGGSGPHLSRGLRRRA